MPIVDRRAYGVSILDRNGRKLRSSSFRMVVLSLADYRMISGYVLYHCIGSVWARVLYHVHQDQHFRYCTARLHQFRTIFLSIRPVPANTIGTVGCALDVTTAQYYCIRHIMLRLTHFVSWEIISNSC